jgi:two-component system chemotaxis sensor kinase CheA
MRNIFALTSALENRGLNVIAAKNGIECLEKIKKHPEIDIILMDIMMPQMNGYEAMEKIRSSEDMSVKNLPIVALTAKAMKEDHEKCMQAGANDYISKPVNLDNLDTVLKVWLPRNERGIDAPSY